MSAPAPGAVLRLATWNAGAVTVTVCPLCATLVVRDGLDQHARLHALDRDDTSTATEENDR